jgi:hypothetical protein
MAIFNSYVKLPEGKITIADSDNSDNTIQNIATLYIYKDNTTNCDDN